MNRNNKYLAVLLCGIVLLWSVVHTETKNPDIGDESISDLVTKIITTSKNDYPIAEDAYVAFEITVDGDYNNILLNLSLYSYNEQNELVEYTYTKENNEQMEQSVSSYTDISENPNSYLTVNEFEELMEHIEQVPLNSIDGQNYVLTTREFTKDSQLGMQPIAYVYSKGSYQSESVENLAGNIGIYISSQSKVQRTEDTSISIIYQ